MSKGAFTDKTSRPTTEAIQTELGKTYALWNSLTDYLAKVKLKGEMKFYGVNYGWALRFTKSGKSVVALYPAHEAFTVQIILNKAQTEAALQSNVSHAIISLIEQTEAIHEGKWLYTEIRVDMDLEDIFTLINIRLRIK